MTVPSREEVAHAIAKERWPDLTDQSLNIVIYDLDVQARAGFPALIGTTHEGCETCGGWRLGWARPCPDGRPVYWTVSE